MIAKLRTRITLAAAVLIGLIAVGSHAQEGPGKKRALSEDNSVGRVLDREGYGARRGVGSTRWNLAAQRGLLTVGDLVKTGTRGANALKVQLAKGGVLILGPGTMAELRAGDAITLLRGEIDVAAAKDAPVTVAGPGNAQVTVRERSVLRARDNQLTQLSNDPRWLTGYKSDASTEALGTLLATVDGRNVPLTIGYHKVTVDIRDGIARTMVEQSFVNHTSAVLEGVFYFPLPAGASVSSFGMWVGDELVEGDIVEKQRARAIYETILREKRDPGLLEWTGGNIFKARVYPISHEKRIRIGYTQVLPRRGRTTTYNYALQSDMLQRAPLRRLELKVLVHSADPLADVSSPSHVGRLRQTAHAASFEWSDDEVTPDRDFELRLTTDAAAPPVRFLPHQRGDDGYFVLAFDAPAIAEGADPTQTAPPMELLLLADTSASMAGPARETQMRFLEALLNSLGPKDRFNVAVCDVTTDWAGPGLLDNTPVNRAKVLQTVEARVPLGWTDIEGSLRSAASRAGTATHVVYIGDGMVTTGDADASAVAARLPELHAGRGTYHAVVPGSSAELIVLGALTRLGGGSMHHIGGGTDPATTAFDLIRDIATPSVKDLQVRFEGLAVASVHPSTFANLPAGGRQLVVGRYDPSAGPLRGRVHVSGTYQGKALAHVAPVAPAAGDLGNSFIPRLWARRRLDHLLEQGGGKAVQEQVITLSEQFQIITPYTSFLVLESEADRERFKVQKQFRIRDGEEFFQKGRDDANFALAQQQMQAARAWRQQLRMNLMNDLIEMHRPMTWQLQHPLVDPLLASEYGASVMAVGGAAGGGAPGERWGGEAKESAKSFRGLGRKSKGGETRTADNSDAGADRNESGEPEAEEAELADDERASEKLSKNEDRKRRANEPEADADMPMGSPAAPASPSPAMSAARPAAKKAALDGLRRQAQHEAQGRLRELGGFAVGRRDRDELGAEQSLKSLQEQRGDYLDALFPGIGAGRGPVSELPWSDELRPIATVLNRRAMIAAVPGAFRFRKRSVHTDRRKRAATPSDAQWLLGAAGWVVVDDHQSGFDYTTRWSDGEERGVVAANWKLGRVRPAAEDDAAAWSAPVPWLFGDAFARYVTWKGRVTLRDDTLHEVVFTHASSPGHRVVFHVDADKGVVVRLWSETNGEKSAVTEWSDFQSVGGVWWPGTERRELPASHGGGRWDMTYRVERLDAAAANAARSELLRVRQGALLLGPQPLDLESAKQGVKDGSPSLEQQWMALRFYALAARWELADPIAEAFLKRTGDRLASDAIRVALLQQRRRNEELKRQLMAMATGLASTPREADYGAAQWVLNWSHQLNAGNERAALLDVLQPVFQRHTGNREVAYAWDAARWQVLQALGRPEAVLQQLRDMAERWPYRTDAHQQLAWQLSNRGEVEAGVAVLTTALQAHAPWTDHEQGQLHQAIAQMLANYSRWEEFLLAFEAWDRAAPLTLPEHVCDQYLSALVMLDREAQAWTLAKQWAADAKPDALTELTRRRLRAALKHGLGQGQYTRHSRIDTERASLLVDVARAFLDHAEGQQFAGWIIGNRNVMQHEAGLTLREDLRLRVIAQAKELPPELLQRFLGWLNSSGVAVRNAEHGLLPVIQTAMERWEAAAPGGERQILDHIVSGYGTQEQQLHLQRTALARALESDAKRAAATRLFGTLLALPWTAAHQSEATGLLLQLGPLPVEHPPTHANQVDQQVVALHHLSDYSSLRRADAALRADPQFTLWTRRQRDAESEKAQREARIAARAGLAGLETALSEELRPWVAIERVWLNVKTRIDTALAWDRALELLRRQIIEVPKDPTPVDLVMQRRSAILASRAVATLLRVLALESGGDEAATREAALVRVIDEGLALKDSAVDWREVRYALLMVLDRGDALEAVLTAWFGDGSKYSMMRWGRLLARIKAERGDLPGAVAIVEGLQEAEELTHADWRTIADWATALGDQAKTAAARVRSWEVVGEWQIQNSLQQKRYALRRGNDGVPGELDDEAPLQLRVLLRKATHPGNHIWLIRNLYAPTKDFRLLECLSEGVTGHTAQSIYNFLGSCSQVTDMVEDEAVLDRLEAHLVQVRTGARTDVDRRALRLLEMMVHRRAAAQPHGAQDHIAAAQAALTTAFTLSAEWADGERVAYAGFLSGMGALSPAPLYAEQVRQLRALLGLETAGSWDRLQVGTALSGLLWSASDRAAAVRVLTGVLEEQRDGETGALPSTVNDQLTVLDGYHRHLQQFQAAESLWTRELGVTRDELRIQWLRLGRFGCWSAALQHGGTVSLGRGRELYGTLRDRLLAELARRTTENHAQQLVSQLCSVYRIAHGRPHGFTEPADDVRAFAWEILPGVMAQYRYRGGQNMVSNTAEALRQVVSAHVELEFLIARAENEPAWLRLQTQDFWPQHGSRFARARRDIGTLPAELDRRGLAIVVRELRQYLASGRGYSNGIYHRHNNTFWGAKIDDFAKTAALVAREREHNEPLLLRVAHYLFHGLDRREAAVLVLEGALDREVLGLDGRIRLLDYLQRMTRWEASLPHCAALIAARPDYLDARVRTMRAHFHLTQGEALQRTYRAAVEWCQGNSRWNEREIATIAFACVETRMHEPAITHLREALAIHTRDAPRRGVGDGTLANYYRHLSQVLQQQGRTIEAVDAAAGAIVAWGAHRDQRQQALTQLHSVLQSAKDLPAYVTHLTAEEERSGLENPILRQAVGRAFAAHKAWGDAAAQYRIAIAGQPKDLETHQLLLQALDAQSDSAGAAAALLEATRANPFALELYRDLGDRYAKLRDAAGAERAYTSMIEMQPNEAASHTLMADIRTAQQRPAEAVHHWRRTVAARSDEPAGYLGLADALAADGDAAGARAVLQQVLGRTWETRFGEVHAQARTALAKLDK